MYTLSECCFAMQSIFNALKNMQQQLLLFVRIANINILKPLQTTFHELLSYHFVSVSKVLSNIYHQTSNYTMYAQTTISASLPESVLKTIVLMSSDRSSLIYRVQKYRTGTISFQVQSKAGLKGQTGGQPEKILCSMM